VAYKVAIAWKRELHCGVGCTAWRWRAGRPSSRSCAASPVIGAGAVPWSRLPRGQRNLTWIPRGQTMRANVHECRQLNATHAVGKCVATTAVSQRFTDCLLLGNVGLHGLAGSVSTRFAPSPFASGTDSTSRSGQVQPLDAGAVAPGHDDWALSTEHCPAESGALNSALRSGLGTVRVRRLSMSGSNPAGGSPQRVSQ
jgi:hypothetical protein